MSLQITGTIKKVLPSEMGTGAKGQWLKQPFIITTKDQYPKDIYIEAFGKVSEVVNQLKVGQEVTVYFNVESREYNNKWYTSVRAWKVEQSSNHPLDNNVQTSSNETEEDDLPF